MKHPRSDLSVIIISWNTSRVTCDCVASIKKYLPQVEIIVVDNASSDTTINDLKKYSGIKTIVNTNNLGYARACNIGAKNSLGKFLLFLNSDIRLIDNSLLQMVDYLPKNPQVGAIGPKFLNPNKTPQASVFPDQSIANAFKEFWLKIPSFQKYLPNTEKPSPVFAISGGAILLPRSAFQKIGGWNQKYFFYFEDLDLCRRLHQLNYQVIYYPNSRLIHHHGVSGKMLAKSDQQWRRLIPSSLIYHGFFKHYIINLIIWSGQKIQKIFDLLS